jgi:hypothetical protein
MPPSDALLARLDACPAGAAGWHEFEDACVAILEYLFVPPLRKPRVQNRTYSGIDRRDAVFGNRQFDGIGAWAHLYKELDARLVLVEFKNYGAETVGKDEVDQTRNYLTKAMGRLALLCCNKLPDESAHIRRNVVFSSDEKKVILFLLPHHMREMCYIKERDEDPADLIVDLVEDFYLQHE